MLATHGSVLRAMRWFGLSGIQSPEGGVARFYRMDAKQNARISTEITGYTVSALVYLHNLTGQAEPMEAAIRAGQFLCRSAWDAEAGLFPFEYGGDPEPRAYFFDSGIICRGLLALWRATRDEEFLDGAVRCGESMVRCFGRRAGGIPPVLSLPDRRPVPYEKRWSREPGCYQLKPALAWLELAGETGDRVLEEQFECELRLGLASHDTFLPGTPDREKVMDRLHAYLYFLEGLLARPERADVREALAIGLQRTSRYLRDIGPQFARSDVYAQLLRARLYADSLGAVRLDRRSAGEEAAAIRSFQLDDADVRVDGCFCFGRRGDDFLPFANPVSTAFCAQALALWEEAQSGTASPALRDLV